MQDIQYHETRLLAALRRIGSALERLDEPPAAGLPGDEPDTAAELEIARLTGLLQAAHEHSAQQAERLATLRERHQSALATLEDRLTGLTGQIDAQGVEMQRLRMANVQLREAMRALRDGLIGGVSDPAQINRALLAEVEALQVSRQIETAELDQLLATLAPLLADPAPQEGEDA